MCSGGFEVHLFMAKPWLIGRTMKVPSWNTRILEQEKMKTAYHLLIRRVVAEEVSSHQTPRGKFFGFDRLSPSPSPQSNHKLMSAIIYSNIPSHDVIIPQLHTLFLPLEMISTTIIPGQRHGS